MRGIVDIAKALGDPSRIRILTALRGRRLCVCQLVELLDLAASTVSKHMSVLRQAWLVDYSKEGRWVYYRRAGQEAPERAQAALRWLDTHLDDDEVLRRDQQRLEAILSKPLEESCERS